VPSSWNLLLALAINDRGEILARGQLNGGHMQTVLLKPIQTKDQESVKELVPQLETPQVYAGPRALHRNPDGRFVEVW